MSWGGADGTHMQGRGPQSSSEHQLPERTSRPASQPWCPLGIPADPSNKWKAQGARGPLRWLSNTAPPTPVHCLWSLALGQDGGGPWVQVITGW